jgi:hypothetical protein
MLVQLTREDFVSAPREPPANSGFLELDFSSGCSFVYTSGTVNLPHSSFFSLHPLRSSTMEAILMSLVKSAGSTLAKQIAEGLAGGMNLEFMKSKEGKLMQELQVLKTKIDEMGKSTIEAIRKQKIANAADRVRNCFARLEDAAKVRCFLYNAHLPSIDFVLS